MVAAREDRLRQPLEGYPQVEVQAQRDPEFCGLVTRAICGHLQSPVYSAVGHLPRGACLTRILVEY